MKVKGERPQRKTAEGRGRGGVVTSVEGLAKGGKDKCLTPSLAD